MTKHGLTEDERFETHVEMSPDPDGCHVWTGGTNEHGYGLFRVASTGGIIKAHRYVYIRAHGPTDKHVLHTCDNPPCVRLDHLFAGWQEDNVRDMEAKGRQFWIPGHNFFESYLIRAGLMEPCTETKVCSRCGESKIIKMFPTSKRRGDGTIGRASVCRACRDDAIAERKNPQPASPLTP